MAQILKKGLFAVVFAVLAYLSFQTACAPFPTEKLPPPQVMSVEIPERTLVFSDGTIGALQYGWGKGSSQTLTPEEWYTEARKDDTTSIPIMFFSRYGYVERVLLQKNGGMDGSSTAAFAGSSTLEGVTPWPFYFRWEIDTEKIKVDRDKGEVVYEAKGGAGPLSMLFFVTGFFCFCGFVVSLGGTVDEYLWLRRKRQAGRNLAHKDYL